MRIFQPKYNTLKVTPTVRLGIHTEANEIPGQAHRNLGKADIWPTTVAYQHYPDANLAHFCVKYFMKKVSNTECPQMTKDVNSFSYARRCRQLYVYICVYQNIKKKWIQTKCNVRVNIICNNSVAARSQTTEANIRLIPKFDTRTRKCTQNLLLRVLLFLLLFISVNDTNEYSHRTLCVLACYNSLFVHMLDAPIYLSQHISLLKFQCMK